MEAIEELESHTYAPQLAKAAGPRGVGGPKRDREGAMGVGTGTIDDSGEESNSRRAAGTRIGGGTPIRVDQNRARVRPVNYALVKGPGLGSLLLTPVTGVADTTDFWRRPLQSEKGADNNTVNQGDRARTVVNREVTCHPAVEVEDNQKVDNKLPRALGPGGGVVGKEGLIQIAHAPNERRRIAIRDRELKESSRDRGAIQKGVRQVIHARATEKARRKRIQGNNRPPIQSKVAKSPSVRFGVETYFELVIANRGREFLGHAAQVGLQEGLLNPSSNADVSIVSRPKVGKQPALETDKHPGLPVMVGIMT